MSIFATARALGILRNDLRDLRDEVNRLDTANKKLGLEWEELYDKVRHQMSRMARRAPVEVQGNGEFPEVVDAGPGVPGVDPISAKILARRARQEEPE